MITVYDYWLAERLIGRQKYTKAVCELFSDAKSVYYEEFSDAARFPSLSRGVINALRSKSLDKANAALRECIKQDIRSIRFGTHEYPTLLADIEAPPYILFVKGNAALLKDPFCVTMVGTRSMTTAGKYSAFRMAYELASAGACIVSGMALGIDSMAHAGALAASGKTVAVLGCGVDVIYPKAHAALYRQILKRGGAIVSEFLPSSSPYPGNFPMRNRIMAGLSYSTLVVEATDESGSLITAAEAVKEGREAFAMPGYLYSAASIGTNKLIESGIRTLLGSDTVIREYAERSGSDVNCRRNSRLTQKLCDSFIDELGIATRVYDPPKALIKMDPQEVLGVADDSAGTFPFNVVLEGKEKRGEQSELKASSRKRRPKKLPEEHSEKSEEKSEKSITYEELRSECSDFGLDISDEIDGLLKKLSTLSEFDVELLSGNGASTQSVLQLITVLTSLGLADEYAPAKFKLCKITE